MPILYMPIGLPGCGKSSHRVDGAKIVCKDDIRFMLLNYPKSGIHFDENIEHMVDTVEKALFFMCVSADFDIYLDETNHIAERRKWYWELAIERGYDVKFLFFHNPIEAIDKNLLRERTVPREVMTKILFEFETPTYEEYQIGTVQVIKSHG